MQRILQLLISCFIAVSLTACSSSSNSSWNELIPEQSSFVFVPEAGLNVQDIASTNYFPYLNELSAAPMQQITELGGELSGQLQLKALALVPSTSVESDFLWIAETDGQSLDSWASAFYQSFTQNNYDFQGHVIHKLHRARTNIYAAQIQNWIVISKSSLVVENALRTVNGEFNPIALQQTPQPGTLIVNTPKLDRWVEQFAAVTHRPSVIGKFDGTIPFSLRISSRSDSLNEFQATGRMPLTENRHSVLTDAISYENKPLTLDRHIASNAAAFALLRLPPASIPTTPADSIISPLDSLFLNDLDTYQSMAGALDTEFAFQAFSESGLLASGEYLFLRKMNNIDAVQQQLDAFVEKGLISKQEDSYHVNSAVMATLVGSEMATLRDFYLDFSNNVLVMAKRKGLAESVNSDRIRRRVIYYDETYSKVRRSLPAEVSGFVWSYADNFSQFIAPYLKPDNNSAGLLNRFDILSMHFVAGQQTVDVTLNTHTDSSSELPYEELWVMPLSDFELSGKPVFGDLVGSIADEVVFATNEGRVLALASDGTIAMQTSTEGLTPVGSPVLYDWYGNGERIVLLGAGSQIFAWNQNGDLLPRFPIELGETISAPILVTDVLRNGVPEIVTATEDRKLHVLDARGENVRGWPQNTNTVITSQPVFKIQNEIWSVWAYSENTLHSWLRSGAVRGGFPQFVNTRFTDSPIVRENQVLGSGADGRLYSIGTEPYFSAEYATPIGTDSISIHALYASNDELSTLSFQPEVLLQDSTGFIREDVITTQSVNGSVFVFNKDGQLRFTQSLGQPSSSSLNPIIIDLNQDDDKEVIALAEFGRLFAWEVLTEKRLFNLPTSGMKYPVVTDLNSDGKMELIAQTREGLRCWTINQAVD
ncbi:hypothetical protein [Gracilimonas mengyeensis]|uniref:Repeat domain-containing protein n=1 Tax=Gracilimonas mengyeensis TaxID=1302730 RepID=A0A521B4W6_9BACT|nr:hypothetical protein [Gracilimonas mengyeensis]SMO42137.1 hypothetical protein SAMN06265219_10217 [Gracilimonas mengyeensis]